MGYVDDHPPGEFPDSGAIFMSNTETKRECFRRKLFGLPSGMANFVKQVKKGMILFLFEFERRELYGVFRATCDGEINIVPDAFKASGKQFPAQVRFTEYWNCKPLAEHEFRDAIRDNYFTGKKFSFGLTERQVHKLMMLFRTKRIPEKQRERHFLREVNQRAKHNRRFGGGRNLVCDAVEYEIEYGHESAVMNKFVGHKVEEIDDHLHWEGNWTIMIGRARKHVEDRPLINDVAESGYFDDRGSRQAILEEEPNQSSRGLRMMSEEGSFLTGDEDYERQMHNNLDEKRGLANKGSFPIMEKIKCEHDIKDGYGSNFNEPYGKHFGEIGEMDCDGLMDNIVPKSESLGSFNCEEHNRKIWGKGATTYSSFSTSTREQDEYPIVSGSRRSVSTGGRFSGCEITGSERRTLPEHPLGIPRRANDGGMLPYRNKIKQEHEEDLRFGPVSPTTRTFRYSQGEDFSAVADAVLSVSKQVKSNSAVNRNFEADDCYQSEKLRQYAQFYNMGKSYGTGLPYSRSYGAKVPKTICNKEGLDFHHRPSYMAAGLSSSPVGNHSFYRNCKENLSYLPMSEPLPYQSQKKGSIRNFADATGFSLPSKSHHEASYYEAGNTNPIEGYLQEHGELKTAAREASRDLLPPDPNFLYPTGVDTAEKSSKEPQLKAAYSSCLNASFACDDGFQAGLGGKYVDKVGESSLPSKDFPSSDVGFCPREDDSIHHSSELPQPCEKEHLNGSNKSKKRVSVFARLSTGPEPCRVERDLGTVKPADLEASVNEVMKVLEESLNSPVRRTGKSKIAARQEEDKHKHTIKANKIVEYEPSKVEMKHESLDPVCKGVGESIPQQTRLVESKGRKRVNMSPDGECRREYEQEKVETKPENTHEAFGVGGSILQETRLVDFKRRKKANMSLDGKHRGSSAGMAESKQPAECATADEELAGKVSDGIVEVNCLAAKPCKRRKLHRPVFVKPEPVNEGINLSDTTCMQSAHEDTLSKVNTPIQQAAVKRVKISDPSADSVLPSAYNQHGANATVADPTLQAKGDVTAENHESSVRVVKANNGMEQPQESAVLGTMVPDSSSEDIEKGQKDATEAEPSTYAEGNGNAEIYAPSKKLVEDKEETAQALEKSLICAITQEASSKNNENCCGWIDW